MVENPPFVLFGDRHLTETRPLRVKLREQGCEVSATSLTRELLKEVADRGPNLVVLDERLDDLGSEILAQIIGHSSSRTAILLLAETPERAESVLPETNVLRVVPRGMPEAELLETIRSLLGPRPADSGPAGSLILCVDDDALYLRSLTRILTRRGYRVAGYENAEQALESLPMLTPKVAIVDIMMPGMSGLQLTEEIREEYGSRLPVILLSGRISDQDIADGYRHGAVHYIPKPCEPQAVLSAVEYFAERRNEAGRR